MKEKKVSQSATKIRIISCTAASCAPFRPRCAHSCRPCAPPTCLLAAPFLQDRAPFRPPSTRSRRPCAPPTRLLVAPFLQGRAPFDQGRCEKPTDFRLFLPTFREKSPCSRKKSPRFSPRRADGLALRGRGAKDKFHIVGGKCAEMRTRSPFFLLLSTFILKKTRYICNENPFYHLCVAKHRDLSSPRCVRRTAYKLPHLARL